MNKLTIFYFKPLITLKDKILENLLEDEEFAQFIVNDYLVDNDMSDEEKLECISLSVEVFNDAVECFKSDSKAC